MNLNEQRLHELSAIIAENLGTTRASEQDHKFENINLQSKGSDSQPDRSGNSNKINFKSTPVFFSMLLLMLSLNVVAYGRDKIGEVRKNSIGMELTYIPAGSKPFTMGSPTSEDRRGKDEGPQQKVTIKKLFGWVNMRLHRKSTIK